jgi:hypothetical protein
VTLISEIIDSQVEMADQIEIEIETGKMIEEEAEKKILSAVASEATEMSTMTGNTPRPRNQDLLHTETGTEKEIEIETETEAGLVWVLVSE